MRKVVGFVWVATLLTSLALAQSLESTRKVTSRVTPAYPDLAKKMHIQGVVKVEVVVRANGTVKSTRALGGNPVLINAATEAVNKWKFEPSAADTTEIVQLTFSPSQ